MGFNSGFKGLMLYRKISPVSESHTKYMNTPVGQPAKCFNYTSDDAVTTAVERFCAL